MDEFLAGYANYASTETLLSERDAAAGQAQPETCGSCFTLTCSVTITWSWTF